jgi:hypothetical protein
MFKGRYSILFLLVILLFFSKNNNAAQVNVHQKMKPARFSNDSIQPKDLNIGFADEREAFDSLVHWVINPKSKPDYGFLTEELFMQQLRKIDTVTPPVMVKAQYIEYKHRVVKSVAKFRKYCKSNSILLKKKDSASGLPALVQWPPIIYKNKGPFVVKRYELEINRKKFKFIFQYELWWIAGRAYWNNEFRYYDNSD